MYASEKNILRWLETELKSKIPFLAGWKIKKGAKNDEFAPDLIVGAKHGSKAYCFCVEIKRAGYPQYIRNAVSTLEGFKKSHPDCYPMVAVPLMGEQGKNICDKHNVGYLDTVGNVKIVTGGIFIEKERQGNKVPDFLKDETRGQSIFSPKASRITKCFLYEPKRKWIQKEIADKTGLSKGMVSRIVKRMINAGYLIEEKNSLILSNFDDLLSEWVEASIKSREIVKRYYVWSQNPKQLMRLLSEKLGRNKVNYAFTQEAGAFLRAPFSTFEIVTLYIESLEKFPVVQLSAQEASKGFNVVLIEPKDDAILTQGVNRGGMKVADDLQLYVDLMKNPLRGEKQAAHLLSIIRKIPV